jgi:hypothetical protein
MRGKRAAPRLAGSAFYSRTTSGYNGKLHTVNGGVRAKARAGWRKSDVGRGARMPRHSIYEYLQVLVRRAHKDNEAIGEGNGPAGPKPKKHSAAQMPTLREPETGDGFGGG